MHLFHHGETYKFWGFTAVIYTSDDPMSFILGVISLFPLIFVVMIFTTGVLHPTKWMGFLMTGMALNFAISVVLKKNIQQMRPEHPWALASREDFGMPSNHSQFMSYLFMACLFSAIDFSSERRLARLEVDSDETKKQTEKASEDAKSPNTVKRINSQIIKKEQHQRHRILKAKSIREMMAVRHALRLVLLFIITILVGYSRVYNVFHTVEQVAAGFGCGIVCAILFYRVPLITRAIAFISQYTFTLFMKIGYEALINHS